MGDSYWMLTAPGLELPSLAESREVDVAVVGGGLSGLHAALAIAEDRPGQKVVLIEADRVCGGASGRTMAKLAVSHSRIYPRLSLDAGRAYVRANQTGFDRTLELIERYDIDCDLRRATNYIFATTEAHVGHVRKDYEAMRRFGLDVEWIDPHDVKPQEIPLDFLVCLKHPDQAQFHPCKFAWGLVRALQSRGVQVYEHTRATNIAEGDEGVRIDLEGGAKIEAQKVVIATRTGIQSDEPFAEALSYWRSHMKAYLLRNRLIENVYTRYDPTVTSFRSNGTDLVLGGSDAALPPEDDKGHYRSIQAWAEQAYSSQLSSKAAPERISWSGEDADSADRLPLIGSYRKNSMRVFMTTGYCGWGMTKAAFAGTMLADLLAGRANPYEDQYSPWRF